MRFSVIIPVYNEGSAVGALVNQLDDILQNRDGDFEIIIVDDGSLPEQRPPAELNSQPNIRVLSLPVHHGQTFALAVGLTAAQGEFLITLDGDGQDDPTYLPEFIDALHDNCDAVCGWRVTRCDNPIKIFISRVGNFIQRPLLRTGVHDLACTYRIYRRRCLPALKLSRRGYHRLIPYFLVLAGWRITELPIHQRPRIHGKSRYSVFKIFEILLDGIWLVWDFITGRLQCAA